MIGLGESEAQVKALVDPGSTHSFLKQSVCNSLGLKIRRVTSATRLANGDSLNISGICEVLLCFAGRYYAVAFSVVSKLITDAIIGLDVLSQHSTVSRCLEGPKEPIEIHNLAAVSASHFPVMDIEPPVLFPEEVYMSKPVTTKARWSRAQDKVFMEQEVVRMLDQGIIEPSTSSWRAQAFVVHKPEDRMVIDYSETVNRFTSLDAYPFPDKEQLLDNAAK